MTETDDTENNFDTFLHESIYMVYHFIDIVSLFMIIINLFPFLCDLIMNPAIIST
jgi:hypothetical protein